MPLAINQPTLATPGVFLVPPPPRPRFVSPSPGLRRLPVTRPFHRFDRTANVAGLPSVGVIPFITALGPCPDGVQLVIPPVPGHRYFVHFVGVHLKALDFLMFDNCMLYLKHGTLPTPTSWDYRSYHCPAGIFGTGAFFAEAEIYDPAQGHWYGLLCPNPIPRGTPRGTGGPEIAYLSITWH
ncbi:MAG TPA: hypothetical protein VGF55_01865 [Gemmataceae bacterium]